MRLISKMMICICLAATASPALARTFVLQSCNSSGWNCMRHGSYSGYSDCNRAARQMKASNPRRTFWCS